MSSFVSQLQYYINFEILECSWAQLEDDMRKSRDMDELIAAHMEFLKKLDDGCLLSDHLWNNLKDLRSIFDQIVRFEVSFITLKISNKFQSKNQLPEINQTRFKLNEKIQTKVYKVILEEAEQESQRRKFNMKRDITEEEELLREDFFRKLIKHKVS